MSQKLKAAILGFVALLGLSMVSACAEIAPANQVGLWYAHGQIDGDHFDHCMVPGKTDDVSWNDNQFLVPTSLRTWNIAPTGGDTNQPLVVTAKPDAGQQSGVEVNVWPQVNFMLNTWCGKDERDPNSPLVQWWQRIGSRYNADDNTGWVNMLNNTVVPALEKAKNVLREYSADELVLGAVWAEAEQKFGNTFSSELERLTGGNFFCGPDFNRDQPVEARKDPAQPDCSSVQVSIKDVDYRDPGIQSARNDKQKAVEQAAAQVAAAEGQVKAAQAQQSLYSNEAWMRLQLMQKQLEIAQACAASQKCTMIIDGSGNVQVHTS